MRLLPCLLICAALTAAEPAALDVVKRSFENDVRSFDKVNDYNYEEHTRLVRLNSKGGEKKVESYVDDVLIVDGTQYRKRIQKDGKPLNAKDAAKEQRDLDKELARRRSESERDREKRKAKQQEQREEARAFRRDVLNAYDFSMMGEEACAGSTCYKILAEPKRSGFKPKSKRGDILSKIHGTIWIDKQSYEWIKVDATTLDTISYGFFLLRFGKGSTIKVKQQQLAPGLWFLDTVQVFSPSTRVMGVPLRFDVTNEYRNFRKFQTDARMVDDEAESTKPEPPKKH